MGDVGEVPFRVVSGARPVALDGPVSGGCKLQPLAVHRVEKPDIVEEFPGALRAENHHLAARAIEDRYVSVPWGGTARRRDIGPPAGFQAEGPEIVQVLVVPAAEQQEGVIGVVVDQGGACPRRG